jgi:hypothetical protein
MQNLFIDGDTENHKLCISKNLVSLVFSFFQNTQGEEEIKTSVYSCLYPLSSKYIYTNSWTIHKS